MENIIVRLLRWVGALFLRLMRCGRCGE